ncbi:MAG: homoserine dehydrogenase [Opitutia bacterium]
MTATRTIGIGILGFGTVGQGVWKHLSEKRGDLESRLGVRIDLRAAAARNLRKKRAVRIPASRLTDDPHAVIDDPKVHVICELIGGTTRARELTLRALRLGKVVVSANKALLCEHGPEIFAAVRRHGGQFLFDASVAGGIPIIKAIREGLVANRFNLIVGILNGTCNHILTRMGEDGLSFPEALKEAQQLGFAEADPTLDVDGIDAWHKASILAWLAHGKWAPRNRTLVEGIRAIGPADIDFARRFGFALKHLAVIRRDFDRNWMTVGVYPALVPNRDILARVSGVNNGITLRGDVVGATTLAGRGAGGDATASAVIGDIVDAIAALTGAAPQGLSAEALASREKAGRALRMADEDEIVAPFYLRLSLLDKAGVSEGVYRIFSRNKVSIARVIQYEHPNQGRGTVTLSTYPVNERRMAAVVKGLKSLRTVLEDPVVLRIFQTES